jgi:ubiquinone/menaquinone biosynthesis C-methylase UbiE
VLKSTAPLFEDLTETTGIPLSLEGASMMYTRYTAAASLSSDKRVLELGCGAGQGFGLLAGSAKSLIGGDYSSVLLESARSHYGTRVPLVCLSADALPFKSKSFDVVLCFEASYYVPDMERAFDDIARVLAPHGSVLFVNANPERSDFIESPHSIHYHTASEFHAALSRRGFAVQVAGAFPTDSPSETVRARIASRLFSLARRVLEGLGLVPTTLKGRARLKRLVHRKLLEVPPELSAGFGEAGDRIPLGAGPQRGYKVLYVQGTLAG